MKKSFWIILLLIFSASLAAEPLRLSLADAIRMSETGSLKLMSQREELKAADAEVKEVSGLSKGSLNLIGAYTRLDHDVTTSIDLPPALVAMVGPLPDIYLGPRDQVHLIAGYTLPLFTGGRLRNSIGAAKQGYEARKQKLESDIDQEVFTAADYYLLCLLTKELCDVSREALETVQKHKAQAEICYETGVVAQYDVIRAKTAEKDMERKLSEAIRDHESALLALKTSLGMDKDSELELTDSLEFSMPDIDQETLLQQAKAGNPGLKALSSKISAADLLVKAEKGSRMPQLSAIAAGQLLTGNLNVIEPKWLVGLNLSMSIFDGGVTNARIDKSKAGAETARLELQDAESYLELGIRTAVLQLKAAGDSLEAARQTVVLSREALRLAERRFETGNGTGIEVLDARTALSAAEAAEKAALYQGEKCLLTIDKYCGNIRTKDTL